MADTVWPSTLSRHRKLAAWAAGLMVLAAAPHLMPDSYWLRLYNLTGLYVMLALGLNVVAGFAGLLDLAYVAFFGIGGYTFALLSSDHLGIHLPFLLVLPLAALLAMLCGFALGATSARLRGDYLAIVTLAFAQIFKLLLLNLDRPLNITGGVNGIYNFDPIQIMGFRFITPLSYSYLIWAMALAVIGAMLRLKTSRYGRGWEAIREDELAAAAIGVNTAWMKLAAFAGGAFIAGGTGAVFASLQDSVFPNNFDFPQLVVVYCMVILGGLGNIGGVVCGAVLLTILPEFLREYGAYRMMSYGAILVLLMALRPQGLLADIPLFKKHRRRPDKDSTGRLRASTDLYFEPGRTGPQAGRQAADAVYARGSRVILEMTGLTRHFGGLTALKGLDLHVHEREILSIIGPNGAGKTTLFNLISGIYKPSAGRIRLEGNDISGAKPHRVVRAGIARTFQNLRLFSGMSVLDNARIGQFCRTQSGPIATVLNLPRHRREEQQTERRAKAVLALFGARLTGYRFEQTVTSLSYANRRRLEIARALATDARILLLDEPAAGMNPQETEEITQFIRSLRDHLGYTIVLIEHKLGLVQDISDRVVVLDYGRKIAEGRFDEVAANPQVIEAYLGRRRN
jgi:branched-chain amino acid transport system permease protein